MVDVSMMRKPQMLKVNATSYLNKICYIKRPFILVSIYNFPAALCVHHFDITMVY